MKSGKSTLIVIMKGNEEKFAFDLKKVSELQKSIAFGIHKLCVFFLFYPFPVLKEFKITYNWNRIIIGI